MVTLIKKGDLVVETRALVDDLKPIKAELEKLGAKLTEKISIEDTFYGDLTKVQPKHTFELSGKASRIRLVKEENGSEYLIAEIREIPKLRSGGYEIHDATYVTLYKKAYVEDFEKIVNSLKEKGFEEFICTIIKVRETYDLSGTIINLDDVEKFGPAIEIKSVSDSESGVDKIKTEQVSLLKKLRVNEDEILKKSHTHMIIDSRIKSDPKTKIPALQKEVMDLEKEREKLLLQSENEYRLGGDGWHDNPNWTILLDKIRQLEARIKSINEDIYNLKKKQSQ